MQPIVRASAASLRLSGHKGKLRISMHHDRLGRYITCVPEPGAIGTTVVRSSPDANVYSRRACVGGGDDINV